MSIIKFKLLRQDSAKAVGVFVNKNRGATAAKISHRQSSWGSSYGEVTPFFHMPAFADLKKGYGSKYKKKIHKMNFSPYYTLTKYH